MSEAPSALPERRTSRVPRWLPFAVILAFAALAFALGLHRHLSFEALRDSRGVLLDWVAAHSAAAPLIYGALYVLVTVCALPGSLVMTLAGGFLFGAILGGVYTVVSATIGAVLLFAAARSAFAELLRARTGGALARLEAGFRRDAFSYLLVLRLVPIFPFFVVNLAAAFLGAPFGAFVVATFIGIIPGTFVYASVGSGLGAVFDSGATPDIRVVFSWPVLGPLLALGLLSLIPVAYKHLKRDA